MPQQNFRLTLYIPLAFLMWLLLAVSPIALAPSTLTAEERTSLMTWSDKDFSLSLEKGVSSASKSIENYIVAFSGAGVERSKIALSQSAEAGDKTLVSLTFKGVGVGSKGAMKLPAMEKIEKVSISGDERSTRVSFLLENSASLYPRWNSSEKTLFFQVLNSPSLKAASTTTPIQAELPSSPQAEPSLTEPLVPISSSTAEKPQPSPSLSVIPEIVAPPVEEAPPSPEIVLSRVIPSQPIVPDLASNEVEKPQIEVQMDPAVEDSPNESELSLEGIAFLLEPENEYLSIQLTSWPEYRMAQTAKGHFVLTINNCDLARTNLSLPRFAPSLSHHFVYAVAKREESAVAINIFVEEGVELESRVKDKALLIRAKQSKANLGGREETLPAQS